MSKPLTMKQAIDKNCFECSYDDKDVGTKHQQIEACPMINCALYPFRPVTSNTKAARRDEKVANMTPEQLMKYREKQEAARIRLGNTRESNSI